MSLTSFPNGLKIGANTVIGGVQITVGDEADDSINVAVQLLDDAGNALTAAAVVDVMVLGSTGDALVSTAPDGDVAIGTDGAIITEHVADKYLRVLTDDTGAFDLDIGEAAAATFRLRVVLPNGYVVTSSAITFAGA